MRRTVRYILATSNPMGDLEALEKFVKLAPDTGADAIALIGNLMPKAAKSRDYAAFFRILSEAHLPTAYVPGPQDAPIWEYLREAANVELVHPEMRNVHETFTFWRGPYLVAGVGGTWAARSSARRSSAAWSAAGVTRGKVPQRTDRRTAPRGVRGKGETVR